MQQPTNNPDKIDKPVFQEGPQEGQANPHLDPDPVPKEKYLVAICWELPFISGLPNYPGSQNLRFESFILELPYFPDQQAVAKGAAKAGAPANFKMLAISPLPGW